MSGVANGHSKITNFEKLGNLSPRPEGNNSEMFLNKRRKLSVGEVHFYQHSKRFQNFEQKTDPTIDLEKGNKNVNTIISSSLKLEKQQNSLVNFLQTKLKEIKYDSLKKIPQVSLDNSIVMENQNELEKTAEKRNRQKFTQYHPRINIENRKKFKSSPQIIELNRKKVTMKNYSLVEESKSKDSFIKTELLDKSCKKLM